MTELHGLISLGGKVISGSVDKRGLKGDTGNGIESVVMTEDYELTITYTDGDVVTLETGLDDYEELLKGYKDDAESAKSDAESAKTDAVDAKNDAVSAKNDAVSAKNDAESAKSDAISAKNDAVSAKTDAQSAKTAAETAQGKAEDAQGYAETAQTAAETAATNANTYQGWAQNYASNAQTQAGYASTHRWAAYDSQVAAAASALVSEGYANGEQNGTPVTSGSPYYHNNAKYYSEQFINAFPTDTASGAIASFEDGSNLFDYLSCIVDIDPVQDLHGYDKPWVGGAGKNKLPNLGTAKTENGITFTPQSDGSVLVNGTATGTATYRMVTNSDAFKLPAGSYIINGEKNSNQSIGWSIGGTISHATTGSGAQISLESETTFEFVFIRIASGQTLNNVVFYPMIRLASVSDATYEPWENICPITGWTGCEVDVSGKNLLPNRGTAKTENGITFTPQSDGSVLVNGTATGTATYRMVANADSFKLPTGSYTISGEKNSNQSIGWSIGGTISYATTGSGAQISLESETTFDFVFIRIASGQTLNNIKFYPMIRLASVSDSTYEPYNGTTYPVTWQTEAGTVYGGTVDVVTGVLTVDRIAYTVSGLSWDYDSAGTRFITKTSVDLSQLKAPTSSAIPAENSLSSAYKLVSQNEFSGGATPNGVYMLSTGKRISVRDTRYTSASDFTTNMGTAQLVFALATPTTYQLDPVQVACLLGQNNVWADCGDIEEVKYKADVQKWVEKQLREINTAILALS